MKLTLAGAVMAATLSLFPAAALAQQPGDWVLSQWQDSTQYFPGVVVARSGRQVTIRFDDGDTETRLADEILPYDWQPGSRIECRWTDGEWYRATIRAMSDDGVTIQVRYDDDGVVQRTSTGKCRTRD